MKKTYLMCQIPIKMLKQHAVPNSSLHNLKIYSSDISAEDTTLDYGFLLRLVHAFTIDTDQYYSMWYKVNGCQDL